MCHIPEYNTTNCRAYDEAYKEGGPARVCIGCGQIEPEEFRQVYSLDFKGNNYHIVCVDCKAAFDKLTKAIETFYDQHGFKDFTINDLTVHLAIEGCLPG